MLQLYQIYVWLPNEAHNGYLDIFNEVGLVGFGIFILIIINYFFNLNKLYNPTSWKWFIIATLIINLQESTIFRIGHLAGAMFVIAYLVLFWQLNNQEKNIIREIDSEKVLRTDLILSAKLK